MPDDRLLHKRAGHSEKVTALTDFEFRVWVQYQWSCDDFGVMRLSAINLQADNDALAQKPNRVVQKAFERLVQIGLLRTFEHQGRAYVYQVDWQDFQKVEYPKPTVNPLPPSAEIVNCSERTQSLFICHPGGKRSRTRHETSPEVSPNLPLQVSDLAHARSREEAMANGLRQEATANGNGIHGRFDRFWAAYPRKVGKDAAWKAFERRKPDDVLLGRMLAAIEAQKRSPGWLKDGGEFIPHPSTWLNQGRWQDEISGPNQPKPGRVPGCRHEPPCIDAATHTRRDVEDRKKPA